MKPVLTLSNNVIPISLVVRVMNSSRRCCLNLFGDDERRTVIPCQHGVGLFIANILLGLRIELQRSAESIRSVRHMNQRATVMAFDDVAFQNGPVIRTDGIDEVLEHVAAAVAGRAGLAISTHVRSPVTTKIDDHVTF